MATHSSILAWEIPWTEEGQATVHGVTESDMTWQLNSERALLKASVTCTAHCQGTVNLIITYVGVSKECAVLSSPVQTK